MARKSALPRIVWFRDDLRLSDHPALHAASSAGAPVICLYILDDQSPGLAAARPAGGAARWWLAQSLRDLQERLGAIGSPAAASGSCGEDHRRTRARNQR